MLFMLIVKASHNSEGSNLPQPKLMRAMDQYNEALEAAGVRVMAKGLQPTSNAVRLRYLEEDAPPVVEYGPFPNTGELVAGFFLIDVASMDEAIAWALRAPDPQGFGEGQIEVRQLY